MLLERPIVGQGFEAAVAVKLVLCPDVVADEGGKGEFFVTPNARVDVRNESEIKGLVIHASTLPGPLFCAAR